LVAGSLEKLEHGFPCPTPNENIKALGEAGGKSGVGIFPPATIL